MRRAHVIVFKYTPDNIFAYTIAERARAKETCLEYRGRAQMGTNTKDNCDWGWEWGSTAAPGEGRAPREVGGEGDGVGLVGRAADG